MTGGSPHTIQVNRAPVLTLWAAVVAERLGFTHDEALNLGRAVAGLNAYSKGVSLGLIHPVPEGVREQRKKLQKGKPDDPAAVTRYLEGKFGDALPDVRGALNQLARSLPPKKLAANAYGLYEKFRPAVPAGTRGWARKASLTLRSSRRSPPEASCVADGLPGVTPCCGGARPNNAGRRPGVFATIGPQPCGAPRVS